MSKLVLLLLATILIAGCHSKPTVEQLLKQSQELQAADKKRQADDEARRTREELGDEIDALVNPWVAGNNPEAPETIPSTILPQGVHQLAVMGGYQLSEGKVFINRKTGALTIEFHCEFFRHETQYLPLLVRLFDANGTYLTRFQTAEVYGRSGPHSSNLKIMVPGSNMWSPLAELKPGNNVFRYAINLRDANYVQHAEFGVYIY